MEIKLENIGQRIDEVMRRSRLNRKSLGDLLGVGEGAVGRYIRGEADPGAAALAKIADLGEITLDELILGEKPNAETLLRRMESSEIEKLRNVLYCQTTEKPSVTESFWEFNGHLPRGHGKTESGLDMFIINAIKASDSETVGAIMELLLKSRSKPEGNMKNGTEG